MRRASIQRLAAVAAWMAVSGARAAVATEIDVSDLRVALEALAPGVTPAASFASPPGSTASSDGSSGRPATGEQRNAAGGRAFGPVATTAADAADAGGAATLAGDVFGAGAFVRTSAYASSRVAQASGSGTVGLVDGVSTAAFTLAPWTAMTITARVDATASCSGESPFESADSGLLMAIGDSQGTGPQFAYVDFNAFAIGAFGKMDDSESTFVSLSYRNDTDAALFGVFSGYVASVASSDLAADPVPEPATAALLVAGWLAAIAAARCRRK
jgi:hypothetical protein